MKKFMKKIALMMAMLLMVSAFAVPQYSEAAAAPKLNVSKKTITGVGTTYKLKVKNQKAGCKYAWKSSNTKIATVTGTTGTGIVKAVAKGTATITCTITYATGTKRVLTAAVTVKVPSTQVKISNANLVNNVHTIEMGDTYDFNRKITPSKTSDKTYWYVEPADYGTIDKNGVFTPAKVGTFKIVAKAADTKAKSVTSEVKDEVLVSVVAKTAKVVDVALKGADELVIRFNTAIAPATVVNADTKQLTSAITIAAGQDEKGNKASDFGNLTGSLSADGKELSVKATGTFNGVYTINLTNAITSTTGIAIESYVATKTFKDTTPPAYMGSVLDDSGMKTIINFSEAIDVSQMTIVSVSSPTSATAIETAILMNASNYVLSADKKSLTVDLSLAGISSGSKTFNIQMQGIKDIAGNTSPANFISAYVYYDTSVKPQATVINITRTSYDTITVQFSRSIRPYGTGNLMINNIPVYSARIDADDNKLVHYTIPSEAIALTGPQNVSVQNWQAYNVASTDTSSNTPVTRVVNFSSDTTAPSITKAKLENAKGVYTLTLEYSEEVTLALDKGTITAKITTSSDDIYPSNMINYTATVNKKVVSLVLDAKQMTVSGKYEIALPEGFVKDAFYNKSAATKVNVTSDATADTTLPAPKSIVQSTTDSNVIVVTFDHKLDLASAQNVSNYTIAGAVVTKAEVESNGTNLAIVNLTVAPGSIPYNANYLVTIDGVKGYNNSYNAISKYTQTIALKENVAPKIVSAQLTSTKDAVTITFDETVTGVASFDVYVNGTLYQAASSTSVGYNTGGTSTNSYAITVYFFKTVNSTDRVTLVPTSSNTLKDANGNVAQINSTVYVY